MTILEIAQSMRALLTPPDAWTQGVHARNSMGNPVSCKDLAACSWCLDGAFVRIVPHVDAKNEGKISSMINLLNSKTSTLGSADYVDWNDKPNRTHEEVLGLLDEIIGEHS